MQKVTQKAILSAKDSVKNASDKLTKMAADMDSSETMPTPEQVKEILASIASIAQEIVAQADSVAQGLGPDSSEGGDQSANPPGPPAEDPKMVAQAKEIDELKKFRDTTEKEKMASEFANLFAPAQRSAKYTEFMKMEKPNSELRTIVSATETALTSLNKIASMPRRTNETIIFQETKQKNASMDSISGMATSLSEI